VAVRSSKEQTTRRRTARGTPATRGREPSTRTAKVTVTVPGDVLEAAAAQVQAGGAPSLSAYVSRALAAQVQADEERSALLAFLDRLDEELGPPTEADYAWACEFASQ
jgi:hypothetical protein